MPADPACALLLPALASARIEDHHYNIKTYFREQLNASLARPMAWIHTQDTWVRQQVRHQGGGGRGAESSR